MQLEQIIRVKNIAVVHEALVVRLKQLDEKGPSRWGWRRLSLQRIRTRKSLSSRAREENSRRYRSSLDFNLESFRCNATIPSHGHVLTCYALLPAPVDGVRGSLLHAPYVRHSISLSVCPTLCVRVQRIQPVRDREHCPPARTRFSHLLLRHQFLSEPLSLLTVVHLEQCTQSVFGLFHCLETP